MALSNPLGRIKNVALDSIKDPRKTAETMAGQARGTVALGRTVVGQVSTRLAGWRHHGEDGKPASTGVAPAPRRSPEQAPAAPQAKAAAPPKAPTAPAEPEVTPADVAKNIAPKPAAKRTTRPPAKKAAAKKAAPGAKLPPRKKTPTE